MLCLVGYPHLSELVDDTKFVSRFPNGVSRKLSHSTLLKPWLLSNIVDENTNNVPEHLHLFKVLERSGVKIGIIGLVEE